MQASNCPTISNGILNGLPIPDLERFRTRLQWVALRHRDVLHETGAPVHYIYFIESGLASVIAVLTDGRTVEVRMVGREGLTGVPFLLGARVMQHEVFVQVPGRALRISAALFKAEFDSYAAIRVVVMRFLGVALAVASQSVACNRYHSMEQRCARWLLMASDRIGSDIIPITHDELAKMLGVRRAGVTAIALKLQSLGLIGYRRGVITIRDRQALQAQACECYIFDRDQGGNLPEV